MFLLILATPLQAIEPRELYQAEVEVPDQGAATRAEGMRQAMAAVLLKVTGTSKVNSSPALAEEMGNVSNYIQQYRYHKAPVAGEEDEEDADERLMLSVRFDRNGIDQLLRRHGITAWGTARPTTLIWLGVEQDNKRELISANDEGAVRKLIQKASKQRALPVKLPFLDLADRSRIRPADIWGGFRDSIEEASARYSPDAILTGRLYQTTSRHWEARWSLTYQGETVHWAKRSSQVPDLIEEGIGHTTEQLVHRFSSSLVSGSGKMHLKVLGIGNLRQYRRVADYLSGVHGVTDVLARRVTPDSVRFSLRTEGGSDAVLQVIALGDVLESAPGSETSVRSHPEGATRETQEFRGSTAKVEQVPEPQPVLRVYQLIP
ncbi:MAG: DUF2066 domain-containing protein [Pseudomonadota bacterium]